MDEPFFMEEKDFMKGYKKKLVTLGIEYIHPFDEDDNIDMLFESDGDDDENDNGDGDDVVETNDDN